MGFFNKMITEITPDAVVAALDGVSNHLEKARSTRTVVNKDDEYYKLIVKTNSQALVHLNLYIYDGETEELKYIIKPGIFYSAKVCNRNGNKIGDVKYVKSRLFNDRQFEMHKENKHIDTVSMMSSLTKSKLYFEKKKLTLEFGILSQLVSDYKAVDKKGNDVILFKGTTREALVIEYKDKQYEEYSVFAMVAFVLFNSLGK